MSCERRVDYDIQSRTENIWIQRKITKFYCKYVLLHTNIACGIETDD